MRVITSSSAPKRKVPNATVLSLECTDFRSLPIPGFPKAKLGTCFVKVTALPEWLERYMKVNPRVPNRTDSDRLSGPVPKAIIQTLLNTPSDMALKNAGIYLLLDTFEYERAKGGLTRLELSFTDPQRHGIVNGGHTFAAIRQTIDEADENELAALEDAYVRLHLMQGIPSTKVAEMAEGLNRAKQVQNPSLENLRGHFKLIKAAMKGRPGEREIAYHEGADGEVDIGEILAFIEMFNLSRYKPGEQPSDLYGRQYKAVNEFSIDIRQDPSPLPPVIERLPEILILADQIRKNAPHAAREDAEFEIGRMKISSNKKVRVASPTHAGTKLHFIDDLTDYKLPNAWLYPMLAAFRSNVDWDPTNRIFNWKVPNDKVLNAVLPDLVSVCVQEHRASMQKPEWVGKRESAYRQCSLYVDLYLARHRA